MPKNNGNKVPIPTLERLATYLAALVDLENQCNGTLSSSDIERLTGINAAQFRKDLSFFGEFGKPGIGYDIQDLRSSLASIRQCAGWFPWAEISELPHCSSF